jgi:hypothetical protein
VRMQTETATAFVCCKGGRVRRANRQAIGRLQQPPLPRRPLSINSHATNGDAQCATALVAFDPY